MNVTRKRMLAGVAWLATGVLLTFGTPGAAPVQAQQVRPPGPGVDGLEAPPPATSFQPEQVRNLMLSIHGYTKADLDAASTHAEDVLMVLADDPDELILVRRQAIKGLSRYPTEAVLQFIESRTNAAPEGLKRLYLNSAGAFAQTAPVRVAALVEAALNDSLVTVRYAGLALARTLEGRAEVQSALQARLNREPDSALRAQIARELSGG